MIQKQIDLIKDMREKVWKTRVSRIEAERRVIKWKHFVDFSLIWISTFLLIISIITIKNDEFQDFNFNLIISLSLVTFSNLNIFRNFSEMASDYKKSYILLHKLILKMDLLIIEMEEKPSDSFEDKIIELTSEYTLILSEHSNHHEIDYIVSLKKLSLKHTNETTKNGHNYYTKEKYKEEFKCFRRKLVFFQENLHLFLYFLLIISSILVFIKILFC